MLFPYRELQNSRACHFQCLYLRDLKYEPGVEILKSLYVHRINNSHFPISLLSNAFVFSRN